MKKKTTNNTSDAKTRKKTKKVGVGKVITGVAVGSVVGATVGLLLAPASGEETISKIKNEAKGIHKNARKAVGKLEDKARGLEDKARGVVKDVNAVKEDVAASIDEHITSRRKNSSS